MVAAVGLAGLDDLAQQLNAGAPEGRVVVGMLDQQPGRLGAAVADQAAAGPAACGDDHLHPGGVTGIHGPQVLQVGALGGRRLLFSDALVEAWMAVQALAGVLVGCGQAQQLLAQLRVNSTRSLGQIRGLSGHAADADCAAW
jgi:hypothetical protein